jgi:hypothetical protein
MTDLWQLLSAGGDISMIGLLVFTVRGMWKLDRRLVRLETLLLNGGKKDD